MNSMLTKLGKSLNIALPPYVTLFADVGKGREGYLFVGNTRDEIENTMRILTERGYPIQTAMRNPGWDKRFRIDLGFAWGCGVSSEDAVTERLGEGVSVSCISPGAYDLLIDQVTMWREKRETPKHRRGTLYHWRNAESNGLYLTERVHNKLVNHDWSQMLGRINNLHHTLETAILKITQDPSSRMTGRHDEYIDDVRSP